MPLGYRKQQAAAAAAAAAWSQADVSVLYPGQVQLWYEQW